jgi:sugar-phosphatase
MAVRLRATGLPVPAVSVTADDVKHGKPDPECFLLGARALNASPDACLVLEDSPAGIAAARAAGMPVIAVRGTHVDRELVDADAIVEDPGAVADLLRSG